MVDNSCDTFLGDPYEIQSNPAQSKTLKGNRNWFDIAGACHIRKLIRQIKSKGNDKSFDIVGIHYVPCSIQPSSTVMG